VYPGRRRHRRELVAGLGERARALALLPDTLVHGDVHGGNVSTTPPGYAFFDWSDAAIGHPFVDMILVLTAAEADRAAELLDAYLDEWHAYGTAEELRATWRAAEVFTAIYHAPAFNSGSPARRLSAIRFDCFIVPVRRVRAPLLPPPTGGCAHKPGVSGWL
jgi:aminoglycoside phosphotransferase (APT) family kinase protein